MRRTVENYAAERAIPIGQVIREALDLFFEIEEYDLYGTEQ
jgi:predicted solute-binding protein